MELYHGSNQIIDSPKLLAPTHPLDFGAGFYATTNLEQAIAFTKKVVRWRGGNAVVNTYLFDENDALPFKVLKFDKPNKKWLDFVVGNRANKEKIGIADIVFGPVANDDVYAVVEAYEAGVYTEAEAVSRLKIKKLFNQYVFKTQEAIDLLKFKGYDYV
jgi:rRNA processing protein Gar1